MPELPFPRLASIPLLTLLLGCGSRTGLLSTSDLHPARTECASSARGQPVPLAEGLSAIVGVAVDDAYVYWAEFGGGGYVRRVPICGGPITTLAAGQSPLGSAIAIDTTFIYWRDGASSIRRVPKTGGSVQTPVAGAGTSPGLAFAVGSSAIYLAQSDLSLAAFPLDGGAPRVVVLSPGTDQSIAVDSASIYWAVGGFGEGILVAPLNGPPTNIGTPLAYASPERIPGLLVTDARSVYWTESAFDGASSGEVCSVPIGGGTEVVLASGQTDPSGIALASGSVFWTNSTGPSSGTVSSVPIHGGPTTIVAAGQNFPRTIAADDTYVYWGSGAEGGGNDGTIQRVAY